MNYDAIVIGGGLGGLTAGAKLAKAGKKVLLIEQHSIPGGCATTFKRKDFRFEVGLHEMDGLHPRDMKTKVFTDLGVFDEVEFCKVPEFYRFVYRTYDLVIPHNPEEAKSILIKNFPSEQQGIEIYFQHVLSARDFIKKSAGEPERNIGEFLDSIIKDNVLKLALLGNLGYFHDDPYSLSLGYYLAAQGAYYAGGGNFIKGGSQKLSDCLAKVITMHGGEVLCRHLVTSILVEDGKAVGVVYKKKNNDAEQEAFAANIVSNASIPAVANTLLPADYARNVQEDIQKREVGASLLSLYLGFNKPLQELGNKNYSVFVYDDSIESPRDIKNNNTGQYTQRSFTFVDYGQVDSQLAPQGKSVGVICAIDYTRDWNHLSKEDYRAKKEEVAQIYMNKLDKLIPGAKEAIEYYELGTAKTVERYTLNPQGAVYGFAQTPERVRLDPVRSIENLYYASAWTKMGGGFSGAILNGYMCAFNILRKR